MNNTANEKPFEWNKFYYFYDDRRDERKIKQIRFTENFYIFNRDRTALMTKPLSTFYIPLENLFTTKREVIKFVKKQYKELVNSVIEDFLEH